MPEQQKKSKGSKTRDQRPARARYWAKVSLGEGLKGRKVRNLMVHCGMTKEAASKLWDATRKRRRTK